MISGRPRVGTGQRLLHGRSDLLSVLTKPAIGENPNWRTDDAGMTQYLKPTATENWDEAMQA